MADPSTGPGISDATDCVNQQSPSFDHRNLETYLGTARYPVVDHRLNCHLHPVIHHCHRVFRGKHSRGESGVADRA